MKLVIAIIRPTKLKVVCEALEKINVTRMTICDAQGFAPGASQSEMSPDEEPRTVLQRMIALEVVVNDDFLERTTEAIMGVARTGSSGRFGDGRILVVPTDEAVQISDASRGPGSV